VRLNEATFENLKPAFQTTANGNINFGGIIAVIAVRSMFAHLLLKDIDKMEKINPYPVCDTPEECIDLYIKDYYSGEQNDIKGKYNIGSILYTL